MDKAALTVDGHALLVTALTAVAGAAGVVVVGPRRHLPPGIRQTREDPPGGGPAAALAAGIAALSDLPDSSVLAVVAVDLPRLTPATLDYLVGGLAAAAVTAAATGGPGPRGAVLVDRNRPQYLLGVWRAGPLRAALVRGGDWNGAPLARLLEPLIDVRLPARGTEARDVDTADDLAHLHHPPPDPAPGAGYS